MVTESLTPVSELEAFAAPFIQSGKYATTREVLHAAMEALRKQLDEQTYDEACIRAAEEGEASGLAEGDIFETVHAELRLKAGTTS